MAIDLSGLNFDDVTISVQGKNDFLVYTQKPDCIQDLKDLPVWTYQPYQGVIIVDPQGIDTIALAERLAATWEGRGYKVTRKVTPLHSLDGKEVQSFILAW